MSSNYLVRSRKIISLVIITTMGNLIFEGSFTSVRRLSTEVPLAMELILYQALAESPSDSIELWMTRFLPPVVGIVRK